MEMQLPLGEAVQDGWSPHAEEASGLKLLPLGLHQPLQILLIEGENCPREVRTEPLVEEMGGGVGSAGKATHEMPHVKPHLGIEHKND